MHCHTSEHSQCSSVHAVALLERLYRSGLQGVVLTDHHFVWPEKELTEMKKMAGVPDHFIVLSGQEVSTRHNGDTLVYGVSESIPKKTELKWIRDSYPAAALVMAHPYRNGEKPTVDLLLDPLYDAIEIFSSNHSVAENMRALRDWHHYKFTALAGTDSHAVTYAGLYPTLFDHPVDSIEELVEDLKKGRCRPFFKEISLAGTGSRVQQVVLGTKAGPVKRERLIIRELHTDDQYKSAGRASYIMSRIAAHGFSKGKYLVPRLIHSDSDEKVLIEEAVHGKSLFDAVVATGTRKAKEFVRLSANWLAKLHNQRLRITPIDEFGTIEHEKISKYVSHFEEVQHPHTKRAREIMEALWSAEQEIIRDQTDLFVQGHGDYHPKNILISNIDLKRGKSITVTAIDFSRSSCFPPAYDIGTFLAQFRNQFFNHSEILEEIPESVFLDSYLSRVRYVNPDFQNQVELFRARTNLGIASYLILVGLGNSENLWRLLVEADNTLTRQGYLNYRINSEIDLSQ